MCGCLFRDLGTYYPSKECEVCFGTGFVGGYEDPVPIILAVPFGEREFRMQDRGKKRVETHNDMWASPFPLLEQYDLYLRQDGTFHMLGPVTRPNHRGFTILQQHFSAEFLPFHHVVYKLLGELDERTRTLSSESGQDVTGFRDEKVQILGEKSPEPPVYFKGRTRRYPTIQY